MSDTIDGAGKVTLIKAGPAPDRVTGGASIIVTQEWGAAICARCLVPFDYIKRDRNPVPRRCKECST